MQYLNQSDLYQVDQERTVYSGPLLYLVMNLFHFLVRKGEGPEKMLLQALKAGVQIL